MGAAGGGGAEGAPAAGGGAGRGARLAAEGQGEDQNAQGWRWNGAGQCSPCAAALLPTPRPSRLELGEDRAVARLLAAAGWMRDLRGPGGGPRLLTPGSSGSPS